MAENGSPIDPPDPALVLKKRARRRLVGAIALALLAAIVLPMVMDQEPQSLTQDIQIRIPSQDPGASAFVSRIAPKLAPTPTPLPQDAGKAAAETAPAPAPAPTPVPAPTQSPSPTAATPAETAPAVAPQPVAKPAHAAPPAPEPKHDAKPGAAQPAVKTAPDKKPAPKQTTATTTATATSTNTAAHAPAPAPEKVAESARAAALLNDEHWIVQLGAYRSADTVRAISARIKALGLPVFTEKVDTPHGPSTRVRSGPFASRDVAATAQERLKKNGIGAPPGGVVTQSQ